jgi:type IV secretory pathway VirB4 component
VNRPQHETTVSVDPKTDYASLIRALGGQVVDLDHHPDDTLNPFHPNGLSAGEQKQAGDSR